MTTAPADATAPTGETDARWMRRALAVAESARGTTRPNPFVGAVLVADDVEVAHGATGPAGTAHAEVRALDAAGDAASGATLYVTLEPCAHVGRTPPCTQAVLHAGIARVVIGLADPNPLAAGGTEDLRAAGVEVETGVLADRVAAQQEVFVTTTRTGRPHLTLKIAQTVDGTTRPDHPGRGWITGPDARRRVHGLRADADAILVGSGTALADDPALTVRDVAPGPRPPRPVVVDRRGRLPMDRQVVRTGTIVVTAATSETSWRDGLAQQGVTVVVADDLRDGLSALLDHDVTAVLAEPGTTLGGALVADDLVDRLLLHVADTTVDDDRPWTPALPVGDLVPVARRRLGADVEWEFRHPLESGRSAGSNAGTATTSGPPPPSASVVREPSRDRPAAPGQPPSAAPAHP